MGTQKALPARVLPTQNIQIYVYVKNKQFQQIEHNYIKRKRRSAV